MRTLDELQGAILDECGWESNFLDALDRFVASAALVWHIGDGYGGWVFEELDRALDAEGLKRKPGPVAGFKKKKIPQSLRTAVFERDEYRCRQCGTHLCLSADHIVPESKGGQTTLDNLQTLCRSCNSSKGART